MKTKQHSLSHLLLIGASLWLCAGLAGAQEFNKELEATLKLIVMVNGQLGGAPVFGAGIIFRREKDRLYVVTANHVVRRAAVEATNIRISLRSLPGRSIQANLLPQVDRALDLAVLSIDDLAKQGVDVCTLPLDRLGDASALKRGDDVYPVGNPNGAAWGMPVRPDQIATVTGDEIAFQSPFIAAGDSGGGLLDAQARLIAMVLRDEPPYGVAIRLARVLSTVGQWGYPAQIRAAAEDGSVPLHKAAAEGDVNKAKSLIAEACAEVSPIDNDGRTPLHNAARAGNAEIVRLLFQAGAKVDAKTRSSLTPLHEAARRGSVDVVKLLLAAGAPANIGDRKNETPLYDAVLGGNLEIVKLLLASGADVNKSGWRYSPLGAAVSQGTPQMVSLLIASGADVNAEVANNYVTSNLRSLSLAAERGNPEIVRQLIAARADVNARSENRETALEIAIKRGRVEVIRLLLAAGADANAPDSNGHDQLLHLAAREGQVEAMKMLLAAGAKVNAEGDLERTPLNDAVRSGNVETVRLLLAAGADLRAKAAGRNGAHSGDTPLCQAYNERHWGYQKPGEEAARQDILKTLIAHSGDGINALVGRDGCMLFDRASAEGDVDVVKLLLAGGANPNAPGSEPLIAAARKGQAEIARILVAANANLNAKDINGYTALHWTFAAAEFESRKEGRMETAKVLLAAGARANTVVGYNGDTPLHDAVRRRAPLEIIKLLLDAGADVSAPNRNSETPLSIATRQNDSEITDLLRSSRARSQQPNKSNAVKREP
jgi:ankyrin repeat protein